MLDKSCDGHRAAVPGEDVLDSVDIPRIGQRLAVSQDEGRPFVGLVVANVLFSDHREGEPARFQPLGDLAEDRLVLCDLLLGFDLEHRNPAISMDRKEIGCVASSGTEGQSEGLMPQPKQPRAKGGSIYEVALEFRFALDRGVEHTSEVEHSNGLRGRARDDLSRWWPVFVFHGFLQAKFTRHPNVFRAQDA